MTLYNHILTLCVALLLASAGYAQPECCDPLLRQGKVLFDAGEYKTAISRFTAARDGCNQCGQAARWLAQAQACNANPNASGCPAQASCCDPLIEKGKALFDAGEYALAISRFTAAMKGCNECPEAARWLAQAQGCQANPNASGCPTAAAQNHCCAPLIQKGKALYNEGEYALAIRKFRAAKDGCDQCEEAIGWLAKAEACNANPNASGCPTATPVAPPVQQPTPARTYIETVKGIGFTMVSIAGGTYQMGDVLGDKERTDETVHTATVGQYYLGETEVTQALWVAVMGSNPSYFKNCAECPVEQVSWEDAQAFIQKLNELTKKKYRLPTEAEWEYAAREGGKSVRFGNGKNTLNPAEANFYGKEDQKKPYSLAGEYRQKTTPVKTFSANGLGLYDMAGNVWEWCADSYGAYPSSSSAGYSGPGTGSNRVLRGGSWGDDPQSCRTAYRNFLTPGHRYYNIGFRLCLSVQ